MAYTLFLYEDALLPFLFPQYRVVTDEFQLVDRRPSILCVVPGKAPTLAKEHPDLILRLPLLQATCDFKLSDRVSVLNYMAPRLSLKLTDTISRYAVKLDDADFLEFVKLSMVFHKWFKPEVSEEDKVYRLFEALLQSKSSFLKLYFQMSRNTPYQELWSAVLTFLNRLDLFEVQRDLLSEYYRKLIFNARRMFPNYRQTLIQLLRVKDPTEVHILSAIMDLRGK